MTSISMSKVYRRPHQIANTDPEPSEARIRHPSLHLGTLEMEPLKNLAMMEAPKREAPNQLRIHAPFYQEPFQFDKQCDFAANKYMRRGLPIPRMISKRVFRELTNGSRHTTCNIVNMLQRSSIKLHFPMETIYPELLSTTNTIYEVFMQITHVIFPVLFSTVIN